MLNRMLLVIVFAVLVSIGNANAGIESFYTTDAEGSATAKSNFGWNEKPWLYVKLSENAKHLTSTWWNAPNGGSFDASIGNSSATTHWLSLSNWASVKTIGTWTAYGNAFYNTGVISNASTNFSVTPEPISSGLFLLGGATLALRIHRKRKNHK